MAQYDVNGLNIEIEEYGDRSNPSLLLVCGWSVQLTYWPSAIVQKLVDAGFHVIAFDNRDSGLSHKTPGMPAPASLAPHLFLSRALRRKILTPYTLEDMAGDAVGVLDALGIDKAHLLGLSMGGMIAQIAASKYPQRFETLTILMSTTNRFGLPRPTRALAFDVFIRPPPRQRDARIRRAVRLWNRVGTPNGGYDPFLLEQSLTASIDRCYTPRGRTRQLHAIIATGDIRKWTRKIDLPALVVHGSVDPLLPPHNGVDIAANIPGARFEMVEGMGHDLPPSHVEQVSRLVIGHMSAAQNPSRARLNA